MRLLVQSSLLFLFIIISSSLSAQQIQYPTSKNFQQGVELFEKGFFEEALKKLEEYKESNPGSEAILFADYYIARANTAIDSTSIEYFYQSFIRQHPKHDLSKVLFKDLGHRFSNKGDYDGAIEYYQNSLKTYNTNTAAAETEYWVAEAAAENDDNEAARKYFLDLADSYPESEWAPKALYARG